VDGHVSRIAMPPMLVRFRQARAAVRAAGGTIIGAWPSSPNAFLGSWILPLTARSDALQQFDGGDGTVGIHGRGRASLLDPLGCQQPWLHTSRQYVDRLADPHDRGGGAAGFSSARGLSPTAVRGGRHRGAHAVCTRITVVVLARLPLPHARR